MDRLIARGACPICGREMIDDGKAVNRHHFVPKSRGGKAMEFVHAVCHAQIHALWTEKELEREYSDPERIRADPRMAPFLAWVGKKPPLFFARAKSSGEKRAKRGRGL